MRKFRTNQAFTLAEVLITLAVIGVVASMTIPTMLSSTNNSQYVAGAKKVYSTLSQAFLMYTAENGSMDSVFAGNRSEANDIAVLNAFAPYLNIMKKCDSGTGCWYSTQSKFLSGSENVADLDAEWSGEGGKAILADGTMVYFSDADGTCSLDQGDGPLDNACGTIYVDVNGAKGPNVIGRDYFAFWVAKTGIYPRGSYGDGRTCEIDSTTAFTSAGCTAKVITESEMNY